MVIIVTSFCHSPLQTPDANQITLSEPFNFERIKLKAKEAFTYCKKKKYNTQYCLLIDMSIHSGKKRAFLWDFKNDTIELSGMCAHGSGESTWSGTDTKENPVFSNTPDSHCSSLGKYKIGKRGYSQWGIHINYLLHGQDSTNSNALKREIVLHSWDDVSDEEVFPEGTPEGWGCPAVGNEFMKSLDEKLKTAEKPILLWIFN